MNPINLKFESRFPACLKNESQKSDLKSEYPDPSNIKNIESRILFNLKFKSRILPFQYLNPEFMICFKSEPRISGPPYGVL